METIAKSLVFVSNVDNAIRFESSDPDLVRSARMVEKAIAAAAGDFTKFVDFLRAQQGIKSLASWDNRAAYAYVVSYENPESPTVIVAPGNPHAECNKWQGPEFSVKRFSEILAMPNVEEAFRK